MHPTRGKGATEARDGALLVVEKGPQVLWPRIHEFEATVRQGTNKHSSPFELSSHYPKGISKCKSCTEPLPRSFGSYQYHKVEARTLKYFDYSARLQRGYYAADYRWLAPEDRIARH